MNKPTGSRPLSFRTVWISDIHLGFRGCSADHLLDFLHSIECEFLYLVGDIIDIWEMKKRMYWPQSHNNVVRTILGKAKHGTKVVYVPGNHDELLRDFHDMTFGNVHITEEAIHTNADGRRLLVIHGDKLIAWCGARGRSHCWGPDCTTGCSSQLCRSRSTTHVQSPLLVAGWVSKT